MPTESKVTPRTKGQIAAHLRVIHNAQGDFAKWRLDELHSFHNYVHGRHSGSCVDGSGKVECVCMLSVVAQ